MFLVKFFVPLSGVAIKFDEHNNSYGNAEPYEFPAGRVILASGVYDDDEEAGTVGVLDHTGLRSYPMLPRKYIEIMPMPKMEVVWNMVQEVCQTRM